MKIKCKTYQPGTPTPKYVQAKLDGIWLTIEGGRCITSRPTDITDSLRWHPLLTYWREYSVANATVHGELWLSGHKRSDVKTAIIEQNSLLRFTPFAFEAFSHATTLQQLDHIINHQYSEHWLPGIAPHVLPPWAVTDGQPPEVDMTFLQSVASIHGMQPNDIEGLVYKDGNLLNWQKWKPTRTIDLVITGRTYGDGKYLGLIGSLLCSVFDHGKLIEVAAISGMDDAVRRTISKQWPAALGSVVEVAYQYVGSRGRLTHPRFLHFREDKVAKDCTVDQDDELLTIWSNV